MNDTLIGAIILAAGEGRRLSPIQVPKPMIPIRDRNTPNIYEIVSNISKRVNDTIVVLGNNSNINLSSISSNYRVVINKYSKRSNTITSLIEAYYNAKDYLNGYIILEADQLYDWSKVDEMIDYIKSYPLESKAFTFPRNAGEWKLKISKKDTIEGYSISEKDGEYCLGGFTYLSMNDLKIISDSFTEEAQGSFDNYWEHIFCLHKDINAKEVIRVDQYAKEFDTIQNLIDLIGYQRVADLVDDNRMAKMISHSITNNNYIINYKGRKKVLRLPGVGTDSFVNRETEITNYKIARECIDTPESEYYQNGTVKMADYVDSSVKFIHNKDELRNIIIQVEELHKVKVAHYRNFISEYNSYLDTMNNNMTKYELNKIAPYLNYLIEFLLNNYKKENCCFSHGDLNPANILVRDKGTVSIIDWEFAGLSPIEIDYASYVWEIFEFNKDLEDTPEARLYLIDEILKIVKEVSPEVEYDRDSILEVSYMDEILWGMWALDRTYKGEDYKDYAKRRFDNAKVYFSYKESKK